jgi:hypothetical protein
MQVIYNHKSECKWFTIIYRKVQDWEGILDSYVKILDQS